MIGAGQQTYHMRHNKTNKTDIAADTDPCGRSHGSQHIEIDAGTGHRSLVIIETLAIEQHDHTLIAVEPHHLIAAAVAVGNDDTIDMLLRLPRNLFPVTFMQQHSLLQWRDRTGISPDFPIKPCGT